MNKQDVSLISAKFVYEADERFLPENRKWQAAPSAAVTKGGRIFCSYSGDNGTPDETTQNYNLCAYSDDGGESFNVAFYAYHEHDVRISEALLFMSPDGELYHFWTQNFGYFDGRGGIWCRVCKDPDAKTPVFDEPRRICDGCMADNPVVLKDGRWIFPSSVWTHIEQEFHPLPEYEKVSIWETYDKTKTMRYVGGTKQPVPDFVENTVYEKADGTLVMLFRTEEYAGGLNVSESKDGGKTWTDAVPFVLSGPSSRFMVSRLPSGALLIVNHYNFERRNNLTALLSYDDGKTFPYSLLLDERSEVSYPSGNVAPDGRVTLAYDRERTGAREILLASFTEEDIKNGYFGEGSFTKKIVSKGGTDKGV